jgi:hypothetical protein
MKVNFTQIIIVIILSITAYAIAAHVASVLKPVEAPKAVLIDSTAINALEAFKREFGGITQGLKTDIKTLKNQRQNVHKEVELFTDSDVIRFNDSISAIYCPANRP